MKLSLQSAIESPVGRSLMVRSLSMAVVTISAVASLTQAQAELVIHNGSAQQQSVSINRISANSASINNTAFMNNNISPTDTSIVKLMEVMHIDEQIESIVNGQQAAINAINVQTQNRTESVGDGNLNKRQQALQEQIQKVLGQYAKIMTNGIGNATDKQTLTQAYINAAKTYYTQAEVDAQIDFYDTVMGQSILSKQPQITAAFLKQSLPDDTSETEAQLGELLPQMQQIIQGVF
ncbi:MULTISPECIES: DUF2059 domain-containing protein [unclassified Psychrobacter]|uniref:DUF2059 domain-containing protein n=1 Tax=unclassified Psychrobacter TaxID=196806 RepID=UPI000ED91FF2|nr:MULTISPECIES: DUF2059 domain-containing protein [unclassified Psychrobacter]MBE8610683.1 DUF2059 domain-containing protein [Pseudomonas lundensis]HCI74912.1 DUF2059 domain-containing protein [Psychrobacter sp.]